MTSDPQPPPPPEPAKPSSGIDFGSLSQGEKFVGLGAVAVLAVYVIWELITEDYFVTISAILLAVFVLGVLWLKLNRPGMSWSVPYRSLLRVAGYLLLTVGVVVFIDELKADIFDAPGGTIAGALVFYAGCVLSGFGAKQLD
jgi:peptidoglycan/LPS O-acetylase OafA/YrhL